MPDLDASEPAMSGAGETEPLGVIEPITCLLCGCLCDDIAVWLDGERAVRIENGCESCMEWFLRDRAHPEGDAVAWVKGAAVDAEEAIARAADLLAAARAPIILGLTYSTNETVRAALALADLIGAAIEPGDPTMSLPRSIAYQRAGRVSATLGEVKDRADVVVFWGADPLESHPRHWTRYSVDPVGRFVPEGRIGRKVIVAARERTVTAERADVFLSIEPEREFEILWTLRAMVRGVELDDARVRKATGCDAAQLRSLASHLTRARYGAWFHASISTGQPLSMASQTIEAMTLLIRELNHKTRFVMLGLGGPGNPAGAEAVLAWQTGFPTSVDLGAGHPGSLPGVTSAADRLARDEADLVLIVGGFHPDQYPEAALRRLKSIPLILIAAEGVKGSHLPDVQLRPAMVGWDDPGTVTRSDGVMLPLRAIRPRRDRSEGEWLSELHDRVLTLIRQAPTTIRA